MPHPTTRRLRYEPPQGIASLVDPKAFGFDFFLFDYDATPAEPYEVCGPYATIDICGPLTKGPSWWGSSYEDIRADAEAAFASEQAAVCMRIDSPGGDLAGCFELARDLRDLRAASGKPLIAFTDGDMLSAAYAIGSAADMIVATEQANVGSIGVWAPLVDRSAANSMYGYKVFIASSGEYKADWNPDAPMTKESAQRLVDQVKQQAQLFFKLVGENRGNDAASLEALKGSYLFGDAGIAARLSDRLVSSWSAFIAEEGQAMPPVRPKGSKYDEAMGALERAAEEDSEDGKKAKEALKKIRAEEPEKKDDEKKDEKEEEKDEKAAARALTSATLGLVTDLASQRRAEAERVAHEQSEAVKTAKAQEAARRTLLFAKRPDLPPSVVAALNVLPIEEVEKTVESFPRITVEPGAAAGAQSVQVSGGEKKAGYVPNLTPEERELLAKSDPNRHVHRVAKAERVGNQLQMPRHIVTPEAADARVKELEAELAALAGGN